LSKDKYAEAGDARPVCECHGVPMRWHPDGNCVEGGLWGCAIIEDDRKREWRKRNPDKVREYKARSFDNQKRLQREWHLRTKFGLTSQQYDDLLKEQRGVCAICGLPPRKQVLSVDHCHDTGTVRGLLHSECNSAIGLLNDDPLLLERAATYLRGSS
jgi:hypothetical protein